MQSKWKQAEADRVTAELGPGFGADLALCVYMSRLIGRDPALVLHGGGNTSVKSITKNLFGEPQKILYVKASGFDMAEIQPESFPGVFLDPLTRTRSLSSLPDDQMMLEMRRSLLDPGSPMPSIEAFLHAFIHSKYVVHTHPATILALTNRVDPSAIVQSLYGDVVPPVAYIRAGFGLALRVAETLEKNPNAAGLVLLQHGLVTWGETAEEAYSATLRLVTQAENYWKKETSRTVTSKIYDLNQSWTQYEQIAPMLRGMLAEPTGEQDHPFRRFVLAPLISQEALELLDDPAQRELAASPPLTPDYLIRTKAKAMFIADPNYQDVEKLKQQIGSAIQDYASDYEMYFQRHVDRLQEGSRRLDPLPRVVMLPGIGAVCCGENAKAAAVARDIIAQSLHLKRSFALAGIEYRGLEEEHLFDMEYFQMQQAKLKRTSAPLERQVAIVTGAAGAIGTGITQMLLENGCHVALTDLPGETLEKAAAGWKERFPHQVFSTGMDVSDPKSVEDGFRQVIRCWGGVDILIVNAGVALVSPLADMDPEAFRRVERINVDGTLLVLREAGRLFRTQATGGDVVLISTKNVFAPGAKFGAYSATKAAAHQLARIASLEFAEFGVRVNMVAPDAVFSHGQVPSGLWAEVGPDRMKARGLDQAGLEDYYRQRNLLKAKVTAEHVARAVLFLVTRQTPTTGATIPVDGGLPDSTPR